MPKRKPKPRWNFVWDTSAIINTKQPDKNGYSPAYNFIKDFSDGWLPAPYLNIFPSLVVFELSAKVSRMHREGERILYEFYLIDENAILYDVNNTLIQKSYDLHSQKGFDKLKGADLVFACSQQSRMPIS